MAQPPEQDPTLQHPRCVFQLLKRHYRALHARSWSSDVCGVHAKTSSWRVAEALCSNSGRERTVGAICTPSAGRSTPSVCRLSAALRCSSSYSATSAAPAAASSHSVATPPSRVRPTLPRSTTSCPATSRCRTLHGARHASSGYIELNTARHAASGATCTAYTIEPAQGVVRRRRRRRTTTTASTTCRGSTGDHSHLPDRARDGWTATCTGCFVLGENPAVGSAERGPAAPGAWRSSTGWSCATWSRPRRRRSGTTPPEVASRRAPHARTSAPRCSSCPPPRTPRRRAASPTRSGSCSGTTRRSSRRATAAPSCGSRIHLGRIIREKLAGLDRSDGRAGAASAVALPDVRRHGRSQRRRSAA